MSKDILFNQVDATISADIINAIDSNYIGSEEDLIYKHIFPYLSKQNERKLQIVSQNGCDALSTVTIRLSVADHLIDLLDYLFYIWISVSMGHLCRL